MIDLLEYYKTEYFRMCDLNTRLMHSYEKKNKTYVNLIKKYKKLINSHDELIGSFLRLEYAYKCYKQSLVPLENESLLEQTVRYDKCVKRLINAVKLMLTELNECGLLEVPRDTVVSSK